MKTLWQQILDFVQPLMKSFVSFIDPLAGNEKAKRGEAKMERFTQRARHVLGMAQEDAERLKHGYIGTEHLLLGLIREVNGMAGSVLYDMKVDVQKAEALVVNLTDARTNRDSEHTLQLSQEMKQLLELSVVEARRLGNHYIGTEHLLLALVQQPLSVALDVLRGLEIHPAEVQRQMQHALQELSTHQQPDLARLTPSSQRILERAHKEAERLQHRQTEIVHVLLSLLREEDGLAAQMLREYKLDFQNVEDHVLKGADFEASQSDRNSTISIAAQEFLDLTVEEAIRMGHARITPEYLLLGLLIDPHSPVLHILRELSVDVKKLRTHLIEVIEQQP
jgi:ATP-dependent Clp protease ATP-binding subunit ClpA